jgi:hypothetical protein
MVLEIMLSKEEEISIIGVYGLLDHLLKAMMMLLDLLIVSLELKHYQFGKQSHK